MGNYRFEMRNCGREEAKTTPWPDYPDQYEVTCDKRDLLPFACTVPFAVCFRDVGLRTGLICKAGVFSGEPRPIVSRFFGTVGFALLDPVNDLTANRHI